MEQQHPIPQQISSYQFRLVGDMTLKQFFQLAGGALLSLLIYATGLHPLIKWPLILFFALSGVALAFLPFEDRPLDKWVLAFFKSIYSPTIYTWQKGAKKRVFYQEEAVVPNDKIVAPQGEKALNAYLNTRADQKSGPLGKLEAAETSFLSRIASLFGGPHAVPVSTPQAGQPMAASTPQAIQQPTNSSPKPSAKSEIKIPETEFIRIAGQKPQKQEQEKPVTQKSEQNATQVNPLMRGGALSENAQGAQFSVEAAPPMPPSQPNTVVGQVMDAEGKIVEGAILEIKDIAGRPVRAVKTNKLGHFLIVTPLSDGTYEIETEKEGLNFEPVKFEASGSIIPPIAIRSQNAMDKNLNQNGQN